MLLISNRPNYKTNPSSHQELQFINGLVRLGSVKMDELEGVIDMLFPLKTPEEKKKMMDVLTEGYEPSKDRSDPDRDEVE